MALARPHSGERALLIGVLRDALARLRGANPEGVDDPAERRRIVADTRAWIEASGTSQEPWSFEWVCEALGLAPSAVRRRVLLREVKL